MRVVESPAHVNTGCDGVFHVEIRNASPWTSTIRLRVGRLPPGWAAAVSFPQITLHRGERTRMPLLVKVPLNAPRGTDQTVSVRAKPNAFSPWLARTRATVRIVDVDTPPAAAPEPGLAPAGVVPA